MVDLSKISKEVQKVVSDIAKEGGNTKKIDTKSEYDKLSAYLAGNQDDMNKPEKEFIQGFMIEYESNETKKKTEAEKQQFEDSVTESTKEAVKRIAKSMGDKKTIDTDAEATALATMLKNTKGDLNGADIEYIKKVLRDSGYASYIEETEKKEGASEGPAVKEDDTTPKGEQKDASAVKEDDTTQKKAPTQNDVPTQELQPKPKETQTPPKESSRVPDGKTPDNKVKPKVPDKKIPDNRTIPVPGNRSIPVPGKIPDNWTIPMPNGKIPDKKVKPEEPTEPKQTPHITEHGRNEGLRLANEVIDEIKMPGFANNSLIKKSLKAVDSTSAYTFVGQFVNKESGGLNHDVFSISDLFNKLDYEDTLHVMKALLEQAKSMGLESNPAFKALEAEINYGETAFSSGTEIDPKQETQQKADSAINWLYNEMNKVLK